MVVSGGPGQKPGRLARFVWHRLLFALVRHLRPRPRRAARTLQALRLLRPVALRAWAFRTIAWPLAADLGCELETKAEGGSMVVDTRDLPGRVVAVSGVWEPSITDVFRSTLGPGDVCVDVGAHVGYYTLLASSLVSSHGHVYSFEPQPENVRMLQRSLGLNRMSNVTVFEGAAGAAHGDTTLYRAPRGNTSVSSTSKRMLEAPAVGEAGDYDPIDVPVTTVDALVPPPVRRRVRLVKIDVEGSEPEVLRGMECLLAAGSPLAVVVELSPQWASEDPAVVVEDICRRYGFECWRLANDYTLDALFAVSRPPPRRIREIPRERCDLVLARRVEWFATERGSIA